MFPPRVTSLCSRPGKEKRGEGAFKVKERGGKLEGGESDGGGRERGFREKGHLEKHEDGKEAKDLSKERA